MRWENEAEVDTEEIARTVRRLKVLIPLFLALAMLGTGCGLHLQFHLPWEPLRVELVAQCDTCVQPEVLRGPAPMLVSFQATANKVDCRYSWDFGDGFTAEGGPWVSHLYTTPGEYTATVRVWDGREEAEASVPVVVEVPTSDVWTFVGPVNPYLEVALTLPREVTVGERFAGDLVISAKQHLDTVYLAIVGQGCIKVVPWERLLQDFEGTTHVYLSITSYCSGEAEVWVYISVSAQGEGASLKLKGTVQLVGE